MEGQNILYGNLDDLKSVKEEIKALEDVKAKVDDYTVKVQKLQKDAKAEEKLLADKIDSTVKKRRDAVASNYDKELKKDQDKLKSVRGNREKAKDQGIKARIALETAELVQENKNLKEEIKTNLKQKKVSGLFKSEFLFGLYFPKGFKDIMTLFLLFLIFVVAIPAAIIYFAPLEPLALKIAVAVLAGVIVPVLYVLGFLYARGNHKEDLEEKLQQRLNIKANKKEIKRIAKSVKKDKDEGRYNLGSFDEDIDKLEKSIEDIVAKKNAAMTEFESVTKLEITDEITERETPRIDDIKKKLNETQLQLNSLADSQKEMSMKVNSKYSAYFGNEYMTSAKIEKLISIMKDGTAKTIGDAINIAKEMQ